MAEKNHKIALGVYVQNLRRVDNDSIEKSVQKLEKIKARIKITGFEKVAREFLAYISEFREGILYENLTDIEKSWLEEYEGIIKSNLRNRTIPNVLFADYIDRLVKIIRLKKKN